jgi:peptide/nickel transport system substrate-binding protein
LTTPSNPLSRVRDATDLKTTGKYTIDKVPISVNGLISDGGNPKSPFTDIRVRKAVEYAIDKESIVKTLFYGISKSLNQAADPENLNYNPAVKGYLYDPKKAKQLLSQAGYPNGFKTKIFYRTTDTPHPFIAIQAYLRNVGIDAQQEIVSPVRYAQIISTGWENALLYFFLPSSKGVPFSHISATLLTSKAQMYKSAVRSGEFDTVVFKARGEPDPKKRTVLDREATKMLTEYAIACPVYLDYSIAARIPRVHDVRLFSIWATQWTPQDAWLNK